METVTLYKTTRGTLKRTNSKNWTWGAAEWSTINPLESAEGCDIRDRASKKAVRQEVYYNVPANFTETEVKQILSRMICMTPFGICPLHYDFAEILKAHDDNANRPANRDDSGAVKDSMFIYHPSVKKAA